ARQYRKGSNAKAWIARITRNEALNLRRSNVREEYVDETENAELFGTEQTDDYGLLIDMARKILPTDELAVLLLAMSDGYKRREIAEMLDMPVSTVTWKYNNAIKKMREALKDR
ncbi:MAG: RNA polymerase sigma factor, partial [Clostridia bacterium]|nr:RNA polymerase sigma factor [Clostridia bacterium]